MRRVQHALEALGVLILVGIFCALPRPWAHWLGRRLGGLAFLAGGRARRVATENLRLRLGLDAAAARRVGLASMRNAGAALADLLRAPRVRRLVVRRDVEIPDATWRRLDRIRREKRGAVIATAHLGNWEFANLACPYSALPPATVIVRPLPNPWLNKIIAWLRGCTGQKLLHRQGAATECMHRVRKGEVVVITFDLAVPPDSGARAVDFFGLPTFTTVAVGYVAAMARAPVYLSYFLPLGGARYRFVIDGPLEAPLGDTLPETAAETTRRVSAALEAAIRATPEAWAWWLKRWRIRPEGTPKTGAGYPSYSVDERWLWPHGTNPRRDAVKA
jgi:KDO2-lipid IV(A) lauroyltransferase